jgi:hypothetical protein
MIQAAKCAALRKQTSTQEMARRVDSHPLHAEQRRFLAQRND